jgi:spore maturation protein CgeB
MKITRIGQLFHKSLIDEVYLKNPFLKELSYEKQLDFIFSHSWVYSNSFSREMNKLGYESSEIIFDLEILQKTWAAQYRAPYRPSKWISDILLQQIKFMKPEILYFQDTNALPYSIRKDLKTSFPFIQLIIIYRGSSSNMERVDDADVLLLGIPSLVKRYSDAGLKPYLLYHAFDKTVLNKIPEVQTAKYDITFLGSSGYGKGIVHRSRYWWLVEILNQTATEMWLDEPELGIREELRFQLEKTVYFFLAIFYKGKSNDYLYKLISNHRILKKFRRLTLELYHERSTKNDFCSNNFLRNEWPKRPLCKSYPLKCHPPLFGIDMFKLVSQSKISLNKHPDTAFGSIGNMRMFEVTGVGSCLLTDKGFNLADLFEEDREVVTYSSLDDCLEKMDYLLEHEVLREQIARAGQKRTLKDHSYAKRCEQLDRILKKRL